MALTNIAGFRDINEYVHHKLENYKKEEKNCETLFRFMFSERENTMAELSDGYRIKKITYGECADKIRRLIPALFETLQSVPKGSMVGLYMANSLEWIQLFWALLACGYKPLLMNCRTKDELLETLLAEHKVPAVLSDGKTFAVPTFFASDVVKKAAEKEDALSLETVWADEIVFMSSGTSENIKLCVYTGENLYYQICDSVRIVETCPQMAEHFEGELKQLTLLPFYHVFGFIAVYVWFGFFSRTFVFLKDMRPQTLLNTIKKHKVTHIFAVPLVWETVYKEALRKIRARGEKTYRKFSKALKLVNATGVFGTKLANVAFKEVRENLFGESIRFMITGGSMIRPEVLAFFNGIGYHLANGYGMTEVGITSMEISKKRKILNTASIGAPFGYTQYAVNGEGELLVKGKTMASKILQRHSVQEVDHDAWFNTHDLAKKEGERYYLEGRKDDLIVCQNGENLNPVLFESSLKINGCDGLCLFSDKENTPTLLISATNCYSPEKVQTVYQSAAQALKEAKLENEVRHIVLTSDPLLEENDFKISRKKIAKRYEGGEFRLIDVQDPSKHISEALTQLQKDVRACFAEILQKPLDEVGLHSNFFLDLGGSSLEYFALIDLIKKRFDVDLPLSEDKTLSTVQELCDYLKNH